MRRFSHFSSSAVTATATLSSSSSATGGDFLSLSSSPSTTTALSGAGLSSSSSVFFCNPAASMLAESQRFLRVAHSQFGYYYRRRGQSSQHWPRYRKPYTSNPQSARLAPIVHWRQFAPYDVNQFLPKANYVAGDWIGLFCLPLDQVYTLHHCTANVPMRVKRFPTTFEYKSHSRWMIGKAMKTWVENKAHIFDEAAITKKVRLELVKQGLLPPG